MNGFIRLLVGIAALLALYFFGARMRAPVIQDDIQTRTSAAMQEAGYDRVAVSTDGRDVTLTGSVESEAAVDAAGQVAWDTWGVRVVDNRLQVGGAAPVVAADPGSDLYGSDVYGTSFCKEGELLVLEGAVPTVEERDRLEAEAALLFPQGSLDDRLEVRADPPDGYGPALETFLAEVVQLDDGCVRVEGTSAEFRGSVRSQQAADRIREQGRAAEALGYDIVYDLDVPTLSEEAALCQAEYDRLLDPGERVLFDFDSSELHEEGRALLDQIAEIGESCPDVGVLVTGHTDSVGDREYNIRLSEERAQVVVDYLVGVGVDPERLTPIGYGFAQPVADNATEEGRAQNRRIEFRVREN